MTLSPRIINVRRPSTPLPPPLTTPPASPQASPQSKSPKTISKNKVVPYIPPPPQLPAHHMFPPESKDPFDDKVGRDDRSLKKITRDACLASLMCFCCCFIPVSTS